MEKLMMVESSKKTNLHYSLDWREGPVKKKVCLWVCGFVSGSKEHYLQANQIWELTTEGGVITYGELESEARSPRNPIGRPGNQWKSSFSEDGYQGVFQVEDHQIRVRLARSSIGRPVTNRNRVCRKGIEEWDHVAGPHSTSHHGISTEKQEKVEFSKRLIRDVSGWTTDLRS
jgi:hypothetical protein